MTGIAHQKCKYYWLSFVLAALLGLVCLARMVMQSAEAIDLPKSLSPPSRSALTAILWAEWWAQVTGGYWDPVLVDQANGMKGEPDSQRIKFYVEIIRRCDLDTSMAYTAAELMFPDAEGIQSALEALGNEKDLDLRHPEWKWREAKWRQEMAVIIDLKKSGHSL